MSRILNQKDVKDRLNELGDCDVVGVGGNQPHDEDSIITKVVVGECRHFHLAILLRDSPDEGQMLLDVTELICLGYRADEPSQEAA